MWTVGDFDEEKVGTRARCDATCLGLRGEQPSAALGERTNPYLGRDVGKRGPQHGGVCEKIQVGGARTRVGTQRERDPPTDHPRHIRELARDVEVGPRAENCRAAGAGDSVEVGIVRRREVHESEVWPEQTKHIEQSDARFCSAGPVVPVMTRSKRGQPGVKVGPRPGAVGQKGTIGRVFITVDGDGCAPGSQCFAQQLRRT